MKWPYFLQALVDLIFPQFCPACLEKPVQAQWALCPSCYGKLPLTDHFRSPGSAHLNILSDSSLHDVPVHALLYFRKGSVAQFILHSIKYNGNKKLAMDLGRKIGRMIRSSELHLESNVLVPVPLHKKKLKSRGYNQSELIALGISQETGYAMHMDVLERTKHQRSQTGKNREARFESLNGTFRTLSLHTIQEKNILLVDDVYTTGATAESCLLALKSALPDLKFHVITVALATN